MSLSAFENLSFNVQAGESFTVKPVKITGDFSKH